MKPVVIDDFLSEDEYEKVLTRCKNLAFNPEWKAHKNNDPHGHWNHSFVKADGENLGEVSDAIPFDMALLWDDIKKKLEDLGICSNPVLIRNYVNAHTFGVDGYFHADSARDDEWTVVIYLWDKEWNPDWAGETVFLDDAGNIELASLPKKNRAVVFQGKQRHAARGLSRSFNGVRRTLMFKFRARRSDDFEKLSRFLISVGARKHQHQKGSLHDHLCRTYQILEDLGADKDTCFGAGLHSIYGTNVFTTCTLDLNRDSPMVQAEFGESAETLAMLFSTVDRPMALEQAEEVEGMYLVKLRGDEKRVAVPPDIFTKLLQIEAANLLDQNQLNPEKHTRISEEMRRLKNED